MVVVVFIGLAGPTRSSAAPNDPCQPSNEVVDAMVSQFGLTPKEARDRIRAECRASAIRPAAQQAAGEAFAGAYFEQSSAVLVVAVTDRSVFDAVAATGATPRLVAASYADLEQDLHVLDSRTGTQPPEVTGWRVDEEANTVVVDVVGGPTQGVKTFVAGLDHVRVDYGQSPVSTTADLVGGMAITSSAGRCSLGFNARNSAGTVYVLTAGHCTNATTTWSGSAGVIGTVAGSSFPGNDYGRIQRTNSIWVPTSKIQGGSSVLGSAVAAVGTTVCRSGSTTGYRCGTIQAMNQTVAYSQGTVNGLTRTSACAEPGDSGGSFVSSSRQAQGVTSGGSGNCTSGGTTFFQPVNEILAVYGLTLFTG
ncbi:MAG TPA: S1 family peptidase [Acidimicrobiales bacterium]|nr:S1 family peptidase [Acidimicrobiales bacterium]